MKNTKRTLTAATLAICLLMPAAANAASFKDMPASTHWAYQGLQYATSKGYMTGYEDHTLRIANSITRAETATMLNRVVGKTAQQKANRFKDMNASNWFYKDMMNLYSLGYISGTSTTTISPNKAITREEAFTILARIAKDKGIERKGALRFKDEETVAPWAKGSIRYLADAGIIRGANGKVNPKSSISRAEFATVLYQLELAKANKPATKTQQTTQKDVTIKTNLPKSNRPDWYNKLTEKHNEKTEKRSEQKPVTPPTPNTPSTPKEKEQPQNPTPVVPNKPREEKPNENPKGYEVARIREATTPVPGPAIPENYRVEATQHIDGRTYYGVRLNNVDAYIIQEVNRIRVENGLKPLKVLANWDEKSYLRATEANMAMKDYMLSVDYENDKANGTPHANRGKYNTKHKRPDGSSYLTAFNPIYVPTGALPSKTEIKHCSENLHWVDTRNGETAEEIAKFIVDGYMNSPGHKANILYSEHEVISSGTTVRTDSNGNIDHSLDFNISNSLCLG